MAFPALRTIRRMALAAALSAAAFPAAAESAPPFPDREPPLPVASRAVRPIAAWTAFCAKDPDSCRVAEGEPERIVLDEGTWRLLVDVNDHVNEEILARTDRDHWDVEDVWGYPDDGTGDCEDFQLLKRRLLERAGLPRRAMRMTVVLDELNEGHAVLSVLTDRGDLILDNKGGGPANAAPILHARETGYQFVKREGSEPGPDGGAWVALDGEAAPAAVAAATAR